jgi:hypothetical protein
MPPVPPIPAELWDQIPHAAQAAILALVQQALLRVLPRAGVVQAARGRTGQSEGIVEFTVDEESGVTGEGGAVEL